MTSAHDPKKPVSDRRWTEGWEDSVDGVGYRVVRGSKSQNDLRLDWRAGGGWRPVAMRTGALLADFFYENEHVLYPPPRLQGGERYLGYIEQAARGGWAPAELTLREQSFRRQIVEAVDMSGAMGPPPHGPCRLCGADCWGSDDTGPVHRCCAMAEARGETRCYACAESRRAAHAATRIANLRKRQ